MESPSFSIEQHWASNAFYVETATKIMVWKDVDVRARTRPAWYYFIRIRATDKFDTRARVARVASWDRNVERVLLSCETARARLMIT